MKRDFFKYGNLVAFTAVVVINILATFGVLGGITTKDVSYLYPSLLTPADYAFSIWSAIYILLAITVYLQMKNEELRDQLGYWFMASCALNIAWIFAWQFKGMAISFFLILALLLNLIILMRSMREAKLISSIAVGLYTGWINVAMLANLGAWLGINGNGLAIGCLVFGLAWIGFFLYEYKNYYYVLGACWGYMGIILNSDSSGIQVAATISIAVFAIITFWLLYRRKNLDEIPMY